VNRRLEILRATALASEVQAAVPIANRSGFDIHQAVMDRDLPVLYRPLKGLWGATVTVDEDLQGILVTSKLGLHVQRFTLAHELGHVLLGHQNSFDAENSIGFAGRFGSPQRPVQEIAADTFASELLGHQNLLAPLAKRHKWNKAQLADPLNVYQMALRLGVSFQATCWMLASRNVITRGHATALQKMKPREFKLQLAPESLLTNSWADTWRLTEADSGLFIEAGPDDIFGIELRDKAVSGYLWQLVDAGPNSEIVDERCPNFGPEAPAASRVVYVRFQCPGRHELIFEHRRPWSSAQIGTIDIHTENYGKELGGLSRRERFAALQAENE